MQDRVCYFSKDEIREVFSQSGFISVLNWFLKTI